LEKLKHDRETNPRLATLISYLMHFVRMKILSSRKLFTQEQMCVKLKKQPDMISGMAQSLILKRAFVQIPAHDLKACTEWYLNVFQLKGELPKPGDQYCSLQDAAGKGTLVLWQAEQGTTVSNGKEHICSWGVQNINIVADRIRSMGLKCDLPKTVEDGWRTAKLLDPSGNPILLVQSPSNHSKSDEAFAGIGGGSIPIAGARKNLWLAGEWYKQHLDAAVGTPNESNRDIGLLDGVAGRIIVGNEQSRAHFISNGRRIACFCFWTSDINEVHTRLKNGGVEIESFDTGAGSLTFFDPFGNLIGLVQQPGSSGPPEMAREYKPVTSQHPTRSLTRALGLVKGSAAQRFGELGKIDERRAKAIFEASMEFAGGRYHKDFKVELFQGNWTSEINQYTNKATAARAAEIFADIMGKPRGSESMEPEEVNLGLSSQDVVAAALHIAVLSIISTLLKPVLRRLEAGLQRKATDKAIASRVQISRILQLLEEADGELKALPLPSNVHPDLHPAYVNC